MVCKEYLPRSRWEATATTTVSTRHGVKANLKTIPLSLFNACGSRPRPARINITTNAIPRKILQNNTICISNFSFHCKTKVKCFHEFRPFLRIANCRTPTPPLYIVLNYLEKNPNLWAIRWVSQIANTNTKY